MKKSRLVSLISAAVMCLSAAPLPANALYHVSDDTEGYLDSFMPDRKEVPTELYRRYFAWENCEVYYYDTAYDTAGNDANGFDLSTSMTGLKRQPNNAIYALADGVDADALSSALETFNEENGGSDLKSSRSIVYSDEHVTKYNITSKADPYYSTETAAKLMNFLKEKELISSFDYMGSRYQIVHLDGALNYYMTPITDAWKNPDNINYTYEWKDVSVDEQVEFLDSFVKENNISCTVKKSDKSIVVLYDEDATFEEKLSIANQIYDGTGFSPHWVSPTSANQKSSTVDMFNAVMGDANTDGELSISDAVAVMQSVVNNDKYKLTAQGAFNADLNGDGITPLDAQKIQMKLLDLE